MMSRTGQSPDTFRANTAAPDRPEPVQDSPQEDLWRIKVLDLLTRLVQVQEEVAKHQVQVVQQLVLLGTQVSQTCSSASGPEFHLVYCSPGNWSSVIHSILV